MIIGLSTAGRTLVRPSEVFQQSPALHAIELQRKRLKNVADRGARREQPPSSPQFIPGGARTSANG